MLYLLDAWMYERVPAFSEEAVFDEGRIHFFLGLPDVVVETVISTPLGPITVYSRGDEAVTRKVKIYGSLFRLPVAMTSPLSALEVAKTISHF